MKEIKRISAMLLSLALLLAPVTQPSYAEGEYSVRYAYSGTLPQAVTDTLPEDTNTYEDQTEITAKSPSSTKVVTEDKRYTFDGWDQQKKTIDGSDITFTGTWSEENVIYKIEGAVYQYPFGSSETSGSPKSGVPVRIALANGSTTVTTGSDGKFSYAFAGPDERKASGTYSWTIAGDSDHYSASGTADEGSDEDPVENKLYIQGRYIPQASDYQFVESDNVKKIGNKTWVNGAGTYAIEGLSGKQLSTSLDGTASDSIDISVSDNGVLDSFFVFVNGWCSKILVGQKVNVDHGAPVVNSVSIEAANSNTYVKEHGVYGREKAELILTTDITEESQINEVYLFSTVDGKTRRYDAAAVSGSADKYSVAIPLPDEETIMDAQLVKLVATDIFGNRSNEVLIAQFEEGSSVTLEQIAPAITKSESGKKSDYGWYSEKPTLTAQAKDDISGLASLKLSGEGSTIAEETYSDKVTERKTVSGKAEFTEESSSGSYTYTVEAKDNSGNVSTDTFRVKIDLTAPALEVTGVESGEHYRSGPTIKIAEEEKYYTEEGNRIFVKAVRDGKTVFDKTYTKVDSVSVPSSVFDADGVYAVTISAKDAADNGSETLSYTFVKDSTAPVVTVSGVREGAFYNKRQTVTVSVVEKNYSTDNVTISAVKKLGNSTRNMGFPWSNTGVESESSKTFSETGTYTITATAVDKAGNQGGPKSVSFTVDTEPPVITITGVKDGGVYTYGQSLNPDAIVEDDYLASKSIFFTKGGQPVSNPSFAQIKENDGVYTMTVIASDKAGNTARKEITFVVNRFGSWFEYNTAVKDLQGRAVQNVTSDLIITEHNVSRVTESKVMLYKDGKAGEGGTTSANEGGAEKIYTHTYSRGLFEEEGAYEINVISKDEAGNEMESKEENGKVFFYVDRTKPNITVEGIDPKGIKAESAALTVRASDLLSGVDTVEATVDGQPVKLAETDNDGEWALTLGEGLRQSVRIRSTDNAGNEAVYEDSVSVSANAFKLWFDRIGKFLIGGLLLLGLLGGLFFFAKRREDDDEELNI